MVASRGLGSGVCNTKRTSLRDEEVRGIIAAKVGIGIMEVISEFFLDRLRPR